jgi:ATP-dependent DNA helicase RecG
MKQHSQRISIPSESETVEWKQSLSGGKEIVETCAAFATSQGGTIYVGISPKGERVGVDIGKGTLEDLANKIKLNTDPPQYPTIGFCGDESSSVVKITVEQNPVKPVWAFGRPMKRVGQTNQRIQRDESQRLLEISTGRTWDAFVCQDFTAKDINMKTVRMFLDRAEMKSSTPLDDVRRNLRLISGNGYTHAAALLFGKFPQRFHVEAQVKCARFKGTSSVHFIDERTFDGNILEQLDNAMSFVARNTKQAIVITGKPAHDIVPEYPDEAVREAIINALCHRNYAEVGTIQIRINDNCLEVWSPGALPPDISIRRLYRQHRSYPRNMLIAAALFRARYIEHWGTGTLRIIEACRQHNINVDFESEANTFIVRLKQKSPPLTRPRMAGKSPTQSPTQLSDPVLRLLSVLQAGELSPNELRTMLDIKHRPTFRQNYLHPALSSDLIRRTIPDKPNSRFQKYRLTAKGRQRLKQ